MQNKVTKRELTLLEKVFEREITGALSGGPRLFQTKSRLAKKLVQDGMLVESEFVLSGRLPVRIHGYELTDMGRYIYCLNVRDEEEK